MRARLTSVPVESVRSLHRAACPLHGTSQVPDRAAAAARANTFCLSDPLRGRMGPGLALGGLSAGRSPMERHRLWREDRGQTMSSDGGFTSCDDEEGGAPIDRASRALGGGSARKRSHRPRRSWRRSWGRARVPRPRRPASRTRAASMSRPPWARVSARCPSSSSRGRGNVPMSVRSDEGRRARFPREALRERGAARVYPARAGQEPRGTRGRDGAAAIERRSATLACRASARCWPSW